MESVQFPHFPASVHIALFNNVKNPASLRARLITASMMEGEEGERERAAVNFAFIDGRLITSRTLLETAVHQALLMEERGALRSKYVHSEILWVLNPSSNISDAIRRFGVNDKTTTLLVVKVTSGLPSEEFKKSTLAAMQAAVEGELLPLSSLPDFTDWVAIKKLYKMGNDVAFQYAKTTEDQHTLVDRIAINTVAIKAVSA